MCLRSVDLGEALAIVDGHEEISEHKRDDGLKLHHNVDGRAGGVLEGITNSVASDSGLMELGALAVDVLGRLFAGPLPGVAADVQGLARLAAEGAFLVVDTDVAAFDVLLGVVPSTTGVGLGDSELYTRGNGASKEATDGLNAEEHTDENRGEDDEERGDNHFLERCISRDLNALGVVRLAEGVAVSVLDLIFLAVLHDVRDRVELGLDLVDHGHGGNTDGLHGEGGEPVRDHGADEDEGEDDRAEDVDVGFADAGREGAEEGEGEGRRARATRAAEPMAKL